MSSKEIARQCKSIISISGSSVHVNGLTDDTGGKGQRDFTFDYCYSSESTQDMPFQDIGRPLIVSALDGFNGTIFAYGQTGSGKSHTMMGGKDDLKGIIPRLNDELWARLVRQ